MWNAMSLGFELVSNSCDDNHYTTMTSLYSLAGESQLRHVYPQRTQAELFKNIKNSPWKNTSNIFFH